MSDSEKAAQEQVLRYRGSGSSPASAPADQAQDNVLRYRGSRGVAELEIAPQPAAQLSAVAATVKPYVCGGSSAMFASCCIHPIDLTKVRLQLIGQGSSTAARPSALKVIRDIIAADGPGGLYKGLSASLTRQATYGTAHSLTIP